MFPIQSCCTFLGNSRTNPNKSPRAFPVLPAFVPLVRTGSVRTHVVYVYLRCAGAYR